MISTIETISNLDDVLPLLSSCELPISDISASNPPLFFGIRNSDSLIGVVGIEIFSNFGLLRSLAVITNHRGYGIAKQLVAHAEHIAMTKGIKKLFLLTTTAPELFAKLGFVTVSRAEAPPAIHDTPQFSGLCPSSSAFMCKAIGGLTHHSSGTPNGAP